MNTKVFTVSLGFVNAYLLKQGDEYLLVDTGMPGQWKALSEGLKSNGCYPGLLKLVVLTHADVDHSGNCSRIKQTFNAPIAVHPLDAPALETGLPPERTIRTFAARLLFGLIGLLRGLRGRAPAAQTFTPDVLLPDGASLSDYGFPAEILHLPGHTKGSIGLLTDTGDFFAGDLCVNRRRPSLSPYVENLDDYRESIAKAKGLSGSISTVYPGHGRSFPGDRLSALSL